MKKLLALTIMMLSLVGGMAIALHEFSHIDGGTGTGTIDELPPTAIRVGHKGKDKNPKAQGHIDPNPKAQGHFKDRNPNASQ